MDLITGRTSDLRLERSTAQSTVGQTETGDNVYEGMLQGHGTKKKVDPSQERLATFENEREGQCQTNTAISDELENRSPKKGCLRYRDRASRLQGEARNRGNKVLRAPGQRAWLRKFSRGL